MARKKISQMLQHVGTPAAADKVPIVDVSDTSMAASGTNKWVRFDAMVQPNPVTRTLWTVGGANDLLTEWTAAPNSARRTAGLGVDAYGFPARIFTIVQSAGPPTSWSSSGSVRPNWFINVPCAVGDVLKLTYTLSWTRSANSMSAPDYASPSIMGDALLDESGVAVRVAHNFATAPDGWGIDTPNTDAGYDYWNHGWAYSGYIHSNSAQILVPDPNATSIDIFIAVGPIWGNLAGVAALSAVHLERIAA